MANLLVLDIETAPHKVYAWGLYDISVSISQIVEPGSTLCWAAKHVGKPGVLFGSAHRHGHKNMIRSIHKLLDECDAVVSYNGKRFDLPTLNKEFILHGLPPPAPFKHIDLYETCKRRFKWASNKLDFVSQALGMGAKVEHKGMELWKGCMDGDDESWRVMEKYNKQDVVLTERLYERIKAWIPNHPNLGQYSEIADPVCPKCASTNLQRRGVYRAASMTYPRYSCKGCGAWSRGVKSDPTYLKPDLVAA